MVLEDLPARYILVGLIEVVGADAVRVDVAELTIHPSWEDAPEV